MAVRAGLDLGSAAFKAAILEDGRAIALQAAPAVPDQAAAGEALLASALARAGRSRGELSGLAVTGYGKRRFAGADLTVDEISANALGAFRLSRGAARLVVNVGGQDTKAILLGEWGVAADFRMNDRCAAGTGRFFERAAIILDVPLERFDSLGREAEAAEISSVCAVFAESEMVSLLSRGTPRGSVIRGLCRAAARRMAALLDFPLPPGGVYLDGGPALNPGLARALGEELSREVAVLEAPQFTVALGAAFSL
ncbi:MAG: acyl-CoA dehydratase activase [Planctomycetota bacterium]|nr:acyl-CoA dehydratase activase [Planctomycetota bacterium]